MIVIDIDGTLTNSIEMFVELNNTINGRNDDWKKVTKWDFRDVCKNLTTVEEMEEIFSDEEFYSEPVFMSNSLECIKRLNDKYKLVLCSVGQRNNIINKLNMLEKVLPTVNVIPIVTPKFNLFDKSMIDCDIIIDDHQKLLNNSKAKLKILFEPFGKMEWNEGYSGIVAKDWLEVERLVNEFYE